MFTTIIKARNYSQWSIDGDNYNGSFSPYFHPLKYKLFHGDNFSFSLFNEIEIEIEKSIIRESPYIPGVLILTKTFGSIKGTKKMYYRCIPNDPHYPSFLVAYEMPMMGFNKTTTNLYILFRFKEWTNQFPIGVIDRIIGPVDIIENLYDYEIFCKGLDNPTMRRFAKEVNQSLSLLTQTMTMTMTKEEYIFSIDPPDCRDYDDAFSIREDNDNIIHLCVYIANVPLLLDKLAIWDRIEQVSTIYLPNKKKTMLPSVLSDDLCSLQSEKSRETMVMEIVISLNEVKDILFYNRQVFIQRNYHYEEPQLLSNSNYQLLERTVSNLASQYTYMTEVKDSHDIVAFLMIMMNHQIGSRLDTGIFRTTEELQKPRSAIYAQWCSQYVGAYIILEKNLKSRGARHEALQLDSYIHITSPIRRIVDIINMILFQQQMGLANFSLLANQFVSQWISKIAVINDQTRKIRRLQNTCDMIHLFKNMTSIEGIILAKDGNNVHIFFLSIRKIFVTSLITEVELSKTYCFCIHIFEDEDKMKKKIRLNVL